MSRCSFGCLSACWQVDFSLFILAAQQCAGSDSQKRGAFARGTAQALCCDKNAIRCGAICDLGIVRIMKTIGMSPSFIAPHVSAETSEAQHFRIAAILQSHIASAMRIARRQGSALAVSSCFSNPSHRIRSSFSVRATHKPASPHNNRIKFAHAVRPTHKVRCTLFAAYAER